ncbi:hypothetical protein CEO90_23350 [Klebsiella pneumoniae]|nr:hypothetical protein AWI31_16765 [Enterobacter hormaechei subsp. xiangfangensis]OZJ73167.1 hypothetical protein CEO93_23355 [Klebsiella pneumoniae]OZJ90035.1 hypothetical protein CEO90_23350 [Klebsiella pneumoniae]OZJ95431.1 hypothetical protein CEO89_23355 [Klebsiella pneumoniae]OZK06116.1 hypothetical protein CEO87_23345 [Klebsiella pneumoniae]
MDALSEAASAIFLLSAFATGVNHMSTIRVVGIDIDLCPIFLKQIFYRKVRSWHEADSKSPFTVILVKTMPIVDE